MAQTIIASLILAASLIYVVKSCVRALSPKKKKGCGCCGCGDKAKASAEEKVVTIGR